MSYAEYFTGHVRLTILKILLEAPGYSANDSILHTAAEGVGLPATRDRIRTELVWLEEQGLLRRTAAHPEVTVASITQRGKDVANGLAIVPGVQRPSPEG